MPDTTRLPALLMRYPMLRFGGAAKKGTATLCPGRFLEDSTFFFDWSATTSSWVLYRGCFRGYTPQGKIAWDENRNFSDSTWSPQSRTEYIYSSSGKTERFYTFYFNDAAHAWDSAYRNLYTYTEEGWLASNLSQKYEAVNSWINSQRFDFAYDTLGHRTVSQSSSWDEAHNEWLPSSRTLEFWENNLDTASVRQRYDTLSSEWLNVSRRSFFYDDAGHRVKEVLTQWDTASGRWINQTMISYTYKDGILTIQDYQTWHTDHWEEAVRYLYYQNEAGHDTLILFQIWNATWQDNYRFLYDYDDCGNLSGETAQLLNNSAGEWDNDWHVAHFVSPFNPVPALTVQIIDSGNVTCYGGNDGWALAEASGGVRPYRWLWDNDPPSTDSLATGLSAGRWYHVTVTDANGNTATDSVLLTEPEPVVTGKICGCPQASLYDTVWYFVCPPRDGYYTWMIKGGYPLWPTTGPGIIVTWTAPGLDSIGVYLTDPHGCPGDTSWLAVYVSPPTTIHEINTNPVHVWPNPAREQIHIRCTDLPVGSIRLTDLSGKIIRVINSPATGEIVLPVQDLSDGIYFLHIYTPEGDFLKKIIIH